MGRVSGNRAGGGCLQGAIQESFPSCERTAPKNPTGSTIQAGSDFIHAYGDSFDSGDELGDYVIRQLPKPGPNLRPRSRVQEDHAVEHDARPVFRHRLFRAVVFAFGERVLPGRIE